MLSEGKVFQAEDTANGKILGRKGNGILRNCRKVSAAGAKRTEGKRGGI